MTKRELVEALAEYPENTRVIVWTERSFFDVEVVTEVERCPEFDGDDRKTVALG